jgi:hypothetical protein
MVCTFVLHVIGACKSILMPHFLVGARGTRVPIIHIKFRCEAHILICKYFDDVGESGVLQRLYLLLLCASWDVRNHLITSKVWN